MSNRWASWVGTLSNVYVWVLVGAEKETERERERGIERKSERERVWPQPGCSEMPGANMKYQPLFLAIDKKNRRINYFTLFRSAVYRHNIGRSCPVDAGGSLATRRGGGSVGACTLGDEAAASLSPGLCLPAVCLESAASAASNWLELDSRLSRLSGLCAPHQE